MPIIAVMVALSSLLVIIFIIIILYMLRSVQLILLSAQMPHRCVLSIFFKNELFCIFIDRFKKYKQAGSHSNSFRLTNGRSDDTGETSLFKLLVASVRRYERSCLFLFSHIHLIKLVDFF